MVASPNFGFLAKQEPQLALLGAQAERYFSDDPSTALFKVRQFAEFLAKLIAAHHGSYGGQLETFEQLLRRLSFERILPRETADVFHQLRRLGNPAVHEAAGDHGQALKGMIRRRRPVVQDHGLRSMACWPSRFPCR